MKSMKLYVPTFSHKILLLLFLCNLILNAQEYLTWAPYGRFTEKAIDESSGFVKSRQFENVFWTHNDSGDKARIFATTAKGKLIRQIWIPAAKNIDWEDIAVDDSGHLIIGDFGNNMNKRKDLTIYVVEEPNPYESNYAKVVKRVPFQFPDQRDFPDPSCMNFDCEATFWANGHLYLLTKHRSDRKTKLYRFGSLESSQRQTLTVVGELDIDSAVTAADISSDGKHLLVLCYEYIYLFEKPEDSDNYLAGTSKRILLEGRSSEGVCFDGSDILFTNEQSEIYRLPVSYFDQYSTYLPPLPQISLPKLQSFRLDGLNKEWTEKQKGTIVLNRNNITHSNQTYCEAPKVQIGWTEDGFLILISDWVLPKHKKNPQQLIRLMYSLGYERTVHLEKGAFVLDFMKSKKEYSFKQRYPIPLREKQIPTFKMNNHDNKHVLEIFIPTKRTKLMGMNPADRCLFNLILNPNTSCEWYWASDSSMYSHLNPYIWGELVLQEK
ncbi:MAG: hypothetical protein ACE5IW_09910 [bacterium]